MAVLNLQLRPDIIKAHTKIQSGVVDAPALGDKGAKSLYLDPHQYNFIRKDGPIAAGGLKQPVYSGLGLFSPVTLLPVSYSDESRKAINAAVAEDTKRVAQTSKDFIGPYAHTALDFAQGAVQSAGYGLPIGMASGFVFGLARAALPKGKKNGTAAELLQEAKDVFGNTAVRVLARHNADAFFGSDWNATAARRRKWERQEGLPQDLQVLGAPISASSHTRCTTGVAEALPTSDSIQCLNPKHRYRISNPLKRPRSVAALPTLPVVRRELPLIALSSASTAGLSTQSAPQTNPKRKPVNRRKVASNGDQPKRRAENTLINRLFHDIDGSYSIKHKRRRKA